MTDSSDVMLARLEERLRTVFENQERDRKYQDELEKAITGFRESMTDVSNRLKRVEESLAKSEPTIEEFITIKHKVVGAGIFGRWVWAGAGILIGVLAATRREIFAWFAG
jgi:predicted  nucleic acid-binding Zn-ribbon protein